MGDSFNIRQMLDSLVTESKTITPFLLPGQLTMHFLGQLIGNKLALSGTLASVNCGGKSKPFPTGVSWFPGSSISGQQLPVFWVLKCAMGWKPSEGHLLAWWLPASVLPSPGSREEPVFPTDPTLSTSRADCRILFLLNASSQNGILWVHFLCFHIK